MVVVAAIIGFMTTILVVNFSRTRVNLDQNTAIFVSAIREAQSQALSSAAYAGYHPCGYGIHYVDSTRYAIYVGPNAATTPCGPIDKNYDPIEDDLLTTYTISNPQVRFKSSFADIFYMPPNPTTYLDNDSSLNQAPLTVTLGVVDTACPAQCQTVSVYPSGNVEVQ